MNSVYWVIPGQLAGRPGPNSEPWDLPELKAGGIGAILSVNDGELCHPQDFAALGINYACIPLSDNAPPQPGDDEICLTALPKAYAFAETAIAGGRKVLVHCRSGKDRTGLFLCYFLMRSKGLSVSEAITTVREIRPIAMSATGWDEFGEQILHRSRKEG